MDYDNDKKPREQQARRSRTTMLLLILSNAASILIFSGAGAALHAHVGRHYPAVVHAWGSAKLLSGSVDGSTWLTQRLMRFASWLGVACLWFGRLT